MIRISSRRPAFCDLPPPSLQLLLIRLCWMPMLNKTATTSSSLRSMTPKWLTIWWWEDCAIWNNRLCVCFSLIHNSKRSPHSVSIIIKVLFLWFCPSVVIDYLIVHRNSWDVVANGYISFHSARMCQRSKTRYIPIAYAWTYCRWNCFFNFTNDRTNHLPLPSFPASVKFTTR